MNPKFKMGDMIQNSGCPSAVYFVANVQKNTDARGNLYTLESPTGEVFEREVGQIDSCFLKNAREFKRQEAAANAQKPDPDFDRDGFPTAEFYRKQDDGAGG